MTRFPLSRFAMPLVACAVLLGVLGFFSATSAQNAPQLPFTLGDDQRGEMIKELREIKELLKEQTAILRQMAKPDKHESGKR